MAQIRCKDYTWQTWLAEWRWRRLFGCISRYSPHSITCFSSMVLHFLATLNTCRGVRWRHGHNLLIFARILYHFAKWFYELPQIMKSFRLSKILPKSLEMEVVLFSSKKSLVYIVLLGIFHNQVKRNCVVLLLHFDVENLASIHYCYILGFLVEKEFL